MQDNNSPDLRHVVCNRKERIRDIYHGHSVISFLRSSKDLERNKNKRERSDLNRVYEMHTTVDR